MLSDWKNWCFQCVTLVILLVACRWLLFMYAFFCGCSWHDGKSTSLHSTSAAVEHRQWSQRWPWSRAALVLHLPLLTIVLGFTNNKGWCPTVALSLLLLQHRSPTRSLPPSWSSSQPRGTSALARSTPACPSNEAAREEEDEPGTCWSPYSSVRSMATLHCCSAWCKVDQLHWEAGLYHRQACWQTWDTS